MKFLYQFRKTKAMKKGIERNPTWCFMAALTKTIAPMVLPLQKIEKLIKLISLFDLIYLLVPLWPSDRGIPANP